MTNTQTDDEALIKSARDYQGIYDDPTRSTLDVVKNHCQCLLLELPEKPHEQDVDSIEIEEVDDWVVSLSTLTLYIRLYKRLKAVSE